VRSMAPVCSCKRNNMPRSLHCQRLIGYHSPNEFDPAGGDAGCAARQTVHFVA